MMTAKEAAKRNQTFRKNEVYKVFEQVEEVGGQEKAEEVVNLEKEKADFISNFPKSKTFTTQKGITVTRKLYSFDVDYPKPALQEIIFTHGQSNYTIWFLNSKKKVCVIDNATYDGNNLFLTVTIDVRGYKKRTYMTLDRFLSLVEQGDFFITLKNFANAYLKDVTESNYYKNKIAEFDKKISDAG